VVDAAQAHETLRSLERIFVEVSDDTDLRSRLGWANGPLADRSTASPFTAAVDWPQEFETTLPVRGGLGLFLTEVLSNAMRHGAAGSSPHVAVQCDRVRKELIFSVENRRRDDSPRPPSKYGGLSLLSGMARLFGWKDFRRRGGWRTIRGFVARAADATRSTRQARLIRRHPWPTRRARP